MIIRVFRAQVHDGRQQEFREFFLNVALPLVKDQLGMISATVGLPHASSPSEFLMITQWDDVEALKGFAGDDWQKAVIHPDEAHLLKAVQVYHYESL